MLGSIFQVSPVTTYDTREQEPTVSFRTGDRSTVTQSGAGGGGFKTIDYILLAVILYLALKNK